MFNITTSWTLDGPQWGTNGRNAAHGAKMESIHNRLTYSAQIRLEERQLQGLNTIYMLDAHHKRPPAKITTLKLPQKVSAAQCVVDHSENNNCIYIDVARGRRCGYNFDIQSQTYDSCRTKTQWAAAYHCLTPLYNNRRRKEVHSIVSIGGRYSDDQFGIAKRTAKQSFDWQSKADQLSFTDFCRNPRAININDNIHIVGGLNADPFNYYVYRWSDESLLMYPPLPFNIHNHGLVRYRNRLIVFGGYQSGKISDKIHWIELSKREMNASIDVTTIDADTIGRNRWQTCEQTLPHKLKEFCTVAMSNDNSGDDGMALVIGGMTDQMMDTLDTIYVFNAKHLFSSESNSQFFTLSKQKIPQSLSYSCCAIDDNRLHIIGGTDYGGDALDTHYIIPLYSVAPQCFMNIDVFLSLFNYWLRMESNHTTAQSDLIIPIDVIPLIELYSEPIFCIVEKS